MPLDPEPKRLSPLHNRHQTLGAHFDLRGDWLIPEVYTASAEEAAALREGVGLIDISIWGKLILKGVNTSAVIAACLGDSPAKPGEVREIKSNQISAAELTPDEFLILTPPGAEKKLATSLEVAITSQDIFASVIDQTSGLVGLSISGPKSTAVMRKLCAIPFSSKDFPNLCVAQSSFAKVRATIIRHDGSDSPAFELFADCSYGEYLWEAILDAGSEFGIRPVGWEAIGASNPGFFTVKS
jgi:heterotetrameric sarcosine oxidase gamma subunit